VQFFHLAPQLPEAGLEFFETGFLPFPYLHSFPIWGALFGMERLLDVLGFALEVFGGFVHTGEVQVFDSHAEVLQAEVHGDGFITFRARLGFGLVGALFPSPFPC